MFLCAGQWSNQGNSGLNFLTWYRNPCSKPLSSTSPFFPDFTMSEEPDVRRSTRTPRPSTRYDPTNWETGSLASRTTTSSATSKRRRRHLQEQLEHALRHEELLAAQLEAHRRTTAIRRALREEENNAIALSSCSPRQPSSTASNSKQPQPTTTHVSADLPPASARDQPGTENETGPEPKQEIAPATGQVLESTAHARTAGAASAHDQRTEESDLNSSFALPPTHSALLPVNDIFLKQSPVHHSVTFATHAAPTPTNAASVAERTAQTTTTSSTSKSPCDHARSRITKPMIETLWMIDSLPSPAPDYRANLNRYQPESKPTSTTSVMTSPYEAAKVPPPLGYLSRSTRGSSSNATAQSIHGVPTEFYHHHLSAEVSAQHSTMDKNNNTVWDLSKMQVPDGHEPRPRLFFDTNDWQSLSLLLSVSPSLLFLLSPTQYDLFFRVGSVAEAHHLSEPYKYIFSPLLSLSLFHLRLQYSSKFQRN